MRGQLTNLNIPEDLQEGTEVTIIAQPGERGVLYRRKGLKNMLFDIQSPMTNTIEPGSIVTAKIKTIRPTSIVLDPLDIKEPVRLQVKAEASSGGPKPVAFRPGSGVILFHTQSPHVNEIKPGSEVSGYIYDETDTYIQLYAEEVKIPRSVSHEVKPYETFPPIHPFIPWILNELVPAAEGRVNPQVMGLLDAPTAWQAFEDLVSYAFELLDIGEVRQLGHKRTGQRYPDGYIFCPDRKRRDYVLLYDAKVRAHDDGYSLNLDDERAYLDYIQKAPYFTSTSKRAFIVISHKFAKSPPQLRHATLTFLPANVLAELVTFKVMNENLINHEVLEEIFFSGKILTGEEIYSWAEHHGLRDFQERFPR